jgi:hypothetical protein
VERKKEKRMCRARDELSVLDFVLQIFAQFSDLDWHPFCGKFLEKFLKYFDATDLSQRRRRLNIPSVGCEKG